MEHLIDKIINKNCLEGMKEIQDNSIDLVITSPPYNLNIKYDVCKDDLTQQKYIEFITRVAEELYRVLKYNGRLCLNIPCDGLMKNEDGNYEKCDITYMIKKVFYDAKFKYRDKIYWDKKHISNRTSWGSWESASSPNILLPFEEIVIFYKKDRKKLNDENMNELIDSEFKEYTNGHWEIRGNNKKEKLCPVPFPQEIPARLLRMFSYRGDIVLDPFSGNGTTCLVAKKLGRHYIGFEISETYTKAANKKLDKVDRK